MCKGQHDTESKAIFGSYEQVRNDRDWLHTHRNPKRCLCKWMCCTLLRPYPRNLRQPAAQRLKAIISCN